MSTLTITTGVLAYEDQNASSNPSKRLIDWATSVQNVPCDDPLSKKCSIDPLSQEVLFDGQRIVSIDGTTEFSLGLSLIDPSRYRITWTGGTAPGFRTNRNLDLSGVTVTLTVNSNATVTASVTAGTPFSAVQEGDVVFIPGVDTGDSTSPFNALNVGYWTVLARANTEITMSRVSGEVFSGYTEAVPVTAAAQFQAFSTAGVQIGDFVAISAGFALGARRSYAVKAVNPSWIEIVSTAPLGPQIDVVPGATGLVFYTNAKRFLRIFADQECVVRLNGATDDSQKLEPWVSGDSEKVATYEKVGPCWRLVLVNLAPVKLNAVVLCAE